MRLTQYQQLLLLLPTIDTDECVPPPGRPGSNGYGWISVGTSVDKGAHAIACEWAHGPKPIPRHEAAHSCGARFCVNPRHLRWATRRENARDAVAHGTLLGRRTPRGEQNGHAKLTANQVCEIRRQLARGEFQRVIAARFGVARPTISHIARGTAWRTV